MRDSDSQGRSAFKTCPNSRVANYISWISPLKHLSNKPTTLKTGTAALPNIDNGMFTMHRMVRLNVRLQARGNHSCHDSGQCDIQTTTLIQKCLSDEILIEL